MMRPIALINPVRLYQRFPFLRHPTLVLSLVIVFVAAFLLFFISLINFTRHTEYQIKLHELQDATSAIRYYDEVLTNSARMRAISGDESWEKLYIEARPKLYKAIQYVLELEPSLSQHLKHVDASNQRLIEMELATFELMHQQKKAEAIDLILSKEYAQEKQIYQDELNSLLADLNQISSRVAQNQDKANIISLLWITFLLLAVMFVLWKSHQVISRRFMLEEMLAGAAYHMNSKKELEFNNRMNMALSLVCNTSNAAQVWVLHRTPGKSPHLISVWRCNKDGNISGTTHAINETVLTDNLLQVAADNSNSIEFNQLQTSDALAKLPDITKIVGFVLPFNVHDELVFALIETTNVHLIADPLDRSIYLSFAEIVVSTLENKIKEDMLASLAMTDGLTKLLNRRQFEKIFHREWHQAKVSPLPSFYLMIDIDWFKKVNDTYGHEIGDLVLVSLSDMLKSSLREQDVLGRYGGEEFCVYLSNMTGLDAHRTAERLRSKVEETPVITEAGTIHFTISIGVAQVLIEDANPDITVKRADQALYQAKNTGRNRVTFA